MAEEKDVKDGQEGLTSEGLSKALEGLATLVKCSEPEPTKKVKKEEDEKVTKSFAEDMDEDVAQGVEVSAFLKGLVGDVTASVDSMNKSLADNKDMFKGLAEGLIGIGKYVEAQSTLIKSLSDRVQEMEKTPIGTAKTTQQGQERFAKSEGEGFKTKDGETLTKSQIADKLDDLCIKGMVTVKDVSAYEAGTLTSNAANALGLVSK